MTPDSSSEETQQLLAKLDGSGSDSEWRAIDILRTQADLPALLLDKYRKAKRLNERTACVFYSLGYAHRSRPALELGLLALRDRSKVVRYRAAMLLAIAQDPVVLPSLQSLVDAGGESAADAQAAIEAIRAMDPNLFVDRDHSGMVTLEVKRW